MVLNSVIQNPVFIPSSAFNFNADSLNTLLHFAIFSNLDFWATLESVYIVVIQYHSSNRFMYRSGA